MGKPRTLSLSFSAVTRPHLSLVSVSIGYQLGCVRSTFMLRFSRNAAKARTGSEQFCAQKSVLMWVSSTPIGYSCMRYATNFARMLSKERKNTHARQNLRFDFSSAFEPFCSSHRIQGHSWRNYSPKEDVRSIFKPERARQ